MNCPFCIDDSDENISNWEEVKMGIVRVEGSRGLRKENLEKWAKDVDISKLPNSEWFRESYIAYRYECPFCFYQIDISEDQVILTQDEVLK